MIISGVHNGSVGKKKEKEQRISHHTFKSDEHCKGKNELKRHETAIALSRKLYRENLYAISTSPSFKKLKNTLYPRTDALM